MSIEDDEFSYKVADDRVRAEAALDGVYVVRTSAGREMMNTAETVLNYKRLSEVERPSERSRAST